MGQYLSAYQARASSRPGQVPTSMYAASNRGYPDVSALGALMPVVINGKHTPVAGTSVSTPIWAGFITLLNDQRVQQGLSVLGFLNIMLYTEAASASCGGCFEDVFTGVNKDTKAEGMPNYFTECPSGFNAVAGWDPATGLGTPRWSGFASLLLNPSAASTGASRKNSSTGVEEWVEVLLLVNASITTVLVGLVFLLVGRHRRSNQKNQEMSSLKGNLP